MRDLLYLAHRIPFPPDKGEKIRTFHILRYLARDFRIHLGCFTAEPGEGAYVNDLKAYCASVFSLPLSKPQGLARGAVSLMRGKSLTEGYFSDRRMHRWVAGVMQDKAPEDIFVSCSSMAPYALPYVRGRRAILDLIDVDSEKFDLYARQASWPLSVLYAMEYRALGRLERKAAQAFTKTFLVSADEAKLLARAAPDVAPKVSFFGNGVEFGYFDPAKDYTSPFPETVRPVVFVGRMDYPPNAQAVRWFAEAVLPGLLQRQPKAQFWIVGAGAGSDVTELARLAGVQVTGKVPDVRPYVAHARCVVAPLKIARGIQNKVLEAMAMARPVVVSPEAAIGINARIGTDFLCAETAQAFVDAVDAVLEGGFAELGANARARVTAEHSWEGQLATLGEAFQMPRESQPAKLAEARS